MQRHHRAIQMLQWGIVAGYLLLLIIPAFRDLPPREAQIFNNLTLFAQFIFWGVWWPFVILSMLLLGRVWCGIFCPEGALAEWTSARMGLGKTVPRWLKWRGWPAVAFILTTLYGQLVSVYDYAYPTLVILGGSTLAAMGVGLLYGRGQRVWCRYLCPVAGVFNLLSRLAPVSFKTDESAWRSYKGDRPANPNCPPMINIRQLHGVSACHMCGRCAGYRDAVALRPRPFNEEVVVHGAEKSNIWEVRLLLYGMIGIAIGAFSWSSSGWLVFVKQKIATWLAGRGIIFPLEDSAPWWILTHYPQMGDSFNWLDGFCISVWILGSGVLFGLFLSASLSLICSKAKVAKHHLAQAYLPMAAAGLFLGLSATTVKLLRYDGFHLAFVGEIRAALLAGAILWSLTLAHRILVRNQPAGNHPANKANILAQCLFAASLVPIVMGWISIFWF